MVENTTGAAPAPARNRTLPVLIGTVLTLLLAGLLVWRVGPGAPATVLPSPTATATPAAATTLPATAAATPAPATAAPPTPTAATPATSTPVAGTPAPLAGAATFTPDPSRVIAGPHVLGITAGVGMRPGEVAGAAPIAVSFSDTMDQASAQAAFALQPAVPGAFRWQQNTLLFTPGTPLAPSTAYTVSMSTAAKTSSGKGLAVPLAAGFKTAPPPAILRTLPTSGAAEVPLDAIVTITFNRPMIPLTSLEAQPDPSQWLTISPAAGGRWVWLGTAAVGFYPAAPGLLPATDYTVTAKAGWPDATGVVLQAGTTVRFTTIKPAILSASPAGGASDVPLDTPIVVTFNQPMDHASVQTAFTLHGQDRNAALPGAYAWSPDSTVLTITPASLLEFSTAYGALFGGPVKAATGNATTLAGTANNWTFTTTGPTVVREHSPLGDAGSPARPATEFSFRFNNPLAPGQDAAQYLTVAPAPEGYNGQVTTDAAGATVYTSGVRLLPNTVYNFALKAGLKDKWGFAVAPATWQVHVGPLPPSLHIKGGGSQPIYVNGPSRVALETANLARVTLHLYRLSEADMRATLRNDQPYNATPVYPGTRVREWDVAIPAPGNTATTSYPTLELGAAADRLPAGFYYLRVTAPSPYSAQPLEASTYLLVGRTGLVIKTQGTDLLVWAADLNSGRPVAGYPLRVESWIGNDATSTQRGHTGPDGVLRITLAQPTRDRIVVWGEAQDDIAFVVSGWSAYTDAAAFGVGGTAGGASTAGALYTDRPIYRPGQVVYYRGVLRLDDDASYQVPNGRSVTLTALTYSNGSETHIYTGTATLSAFGTFNGQFTLPAGAPVGDYNLSGDDLSTSFQVQEYRKPDFQVDVTAGRPEAVQGDPITATIAASYYFGGPLANITTTVNLQASPYYFGWSDPDTGESYQFGEGGSPIVYNDMAYGGGGRFGGPIRPPTAPVQSFQARTDKDGLLTVDVTRYVTTTDTSKSLLVEGQVQDLSNQAVAANTSLVVHQGLYYVGVHLGDYIATAKQPTTITLRTVAATATGGAKGGRLVPNTPVRLRFVRQEWTPPPGGAGDWTVKEVPVDGATVTTDAAGRALYRFTPPSGGDYRVIAESTDSRGNLIHTSTQLWVASPDPGAVSWRFTNEAQVKLVADKPQYQVGDTAHILVTSPFSQATGLLTIERGHLRRYRIVNLQGGAPTVDVPLEAGDLPNVYVGLTLLGPEHPTPGAPADWANHVTLRQGYVDIPLDTSGKQLHVSVAPQGQGPYAPGSTASVLVRTTDSSGKPAPGEFSLAVVDEAIYALSPDNGPDLFGTFWGERSSDVETATSFSAGEPVQAMPLTGGSGDVPMPAAAAAPGVRAAQDALASKAAPAAPAKVRTDFRDTAFWTASVATGPDGSATVPVPLPDNLTTWRLTAQGVTADTRAGMATAPLTVTQPLLLRPVQPRFLITGDSPHPQAIIHNNTAGPLQVVASLEVSGAVTLDAAPPAQQTLTLAAGTQAVVTWTIHVGQGDVANLRYWVHTTGDSTAPGYREDAVGAQLPVQPFAAPEAVATSGEVGGVRADETVFLPFSTNPLLGEILVQISPSLAAATADSVHYVAEYPYESTDSTVSRFLPLVVLAQVYKEQGVSAPFAGTLPDVVDRAISRLGSLQQPDGGWAWWERGPSGWWETAYAVQGLTAARDAGYAVPENMLARGVERLRAFTQQNDTSSLDETYHLDMRAYSLYVLGLAGDPNDPALHQEGTDLAGQTARLSTHARAWLAMGLARSGMAAESKQVLDSLAASARQTSTTAHWEEGHPDYWSMGTDNRATALAIDALVTLSPNDPLVPKAVRWLMSVEKEGHWLSSQETAISLVALAHYIRQSKELGADYSWQVSLADKLLGQGVANRGTLTQTAVLRMPVAGLPQNTLQDLALARSAPTGKMYYQVSLRYYVPGEGIKARTEGLAISRTYYRMPAGGAAPASSDPIKEATAGDLIKVRLTIVTTDTAYYVLVTDPLPAGMEGVNGSLNTTSFTERPPNPQGVIGDSSGPGSGDYAPWYYRWGPFDNVEMRDDRTVLFASYMSPGTYVYEYFARVTTPGVYMALPAHVEMLGFPDVFGHSDGGQFTVK